MALPSSRTSFAPTEHCARHRLLVSPGFGLPPEAAYHGPPTCLQESCMRRLLTGCFLTLLLLLSTLVLFGPLMVFALLNLVLPGRLRDDASWDGMWIAETCAEIAQLIFALCLPTPRAIR